MIDELQRTVERMHHCRARLAQSVPVKEFHNGATVWEGVVHVFDLTGHPKAKRAYAWSSPIEGSDKRRFFAVLHIPPITSPVDAVRAAIVAEHRSAHPNERDKFAAGWRDGWRSITPETVPPPPAIAVPDGFDPYRYGYEQGRAVAGGK